MSGENLAVWNRLNRPPSSALKRIGGGRLSGMTDINPQWRFMALTEEFGPCGVGWKYTIDRLWLEKGFADQVFAFAQISLYVRSDEMMRDDPWCDPIPGIGGSMLVEQERSGMHNNDEAFKMAVTDALSVACKALGVAADIYMGLWDGSKYREATKALLDDRRGPASETPTGPAQEPAQGPEVDPTSGKVSPDYSSVAMPIQASKTYRAAQAILGHAGLLGWSADKLEAWVEKLCGKHLNEATLVQTNAILSEIKAIKEVR